MSLNKSEIYAHRRNKHGNGLHFYKRQLYDPKLSNGSSRPGEDRAVESIIEDLNFENARENSSSVHAASMLDQPIVLDDATIAHLSHSSSS